MWAYIPCLSAHPPCFFFFFNLFLHLCCQSDNRTSCGHTQTENWAESFTILDFKIIWYQTCTRVSSSPSRSYHCSLSSHSKIVKSPLWRQHGAGDIQAYNAGNLWGLNQMQKLLNLTINCLKPLKSHFYLSGGQKNKYNSPWSLNLEAKGIR